MHYNQIAYVDKEDNMHIKFRSKQRKRPPNRTFSLLMQQRKVAPLIILETIYEP
jgi:hypothetical protein